MPLQDTGVAISLSDIQEEFGGDNPISLSEYYKDGDYVGSSQSTIPSSGAISFSNFYVLVGNHQKFFYLQKLLYVYVLIKL